MSSALHILYLEDNPNDAELVQAMLTAEGIACEMVCVETQEGFASALDQGRFDLILSDRTLPSFDGHYALVLARTKCPAVPFIFFSGTMGEDEAVKSLKEGATDYVLKQRPSRLVSAIRRAMQEAQERAERKHAEEKLRQSEEQYRRITDNIADLVAVLDTEGKRIYNSPSYQDVLGDPGSLRGTDSFAEIHPEDRERIRRIFRETVATGVGQRTEYRFLLKDGSIRFIESQGSVIRDEEGKPARVIVVSRDVTERKRAEEELRQTEDQLRHSQKMEAIGQLAGGIAHDFNNLLTVIMGYSELLLSRLQPGDLRWRNAEEIRKAAVRAASLTHQLLAFSRRQVLTPKVLNLNTVVTNLEPMLRRLIGEDIELGIVLSPALGQVRADPGQIEQIILNLAVNSRDAMPQGGKLAVETADVELDENYAHRHGAIQPGPYVMLTVSDTGCGMDADTQSRIFEPFFTTKEPDKGTGLGLSTVYGIVKQSGGYVLVHSEPGRGATFKIYLPRIEDAPETVEASQALSKPSIGTETIMLVEDDDVVRGLVLHVLEENGYTVLIARHSEEALLASGQHKGPIHLMVTDVVMPKMSGRELAERLKTTRPAMKVLYMSGYIDEGIVRHGLLVEGGAVLQKPFTPNALLQKVREVLSVSAMGSMA